MECTLSRPNHWEDWDWFRLQPMSLTWLATIQSQRRLWREEYRRIETRDPLRVDHYHDGRYSRIKHGQIVLFAKLSAKDQLSTSSAFAHAALWYALRTSESLKAKNCQKKSKNSAPTCCWTTNVTLFPAILRWSAATSCVAFSIDLSFT